MKSNLKKIKNLLTSTVMLPFHWISCIIPKDRNLWVFGAWFGERYADNSKFFFEFVNENHPEIKAVWLTKDEVAYNLVKSKGYQVEKINSLKGLIFSLRASCAFVTTAMNDVNSTFFCGCFVQFWHGIPLKKIGYDVKKNLFGQNLRNGWLLKIKKTIIRKLLSNRRYNAVIASSSIEAERLASAFRVPINRVWITGLPRNTVFFQHPGPQNMNNNKYRIIYMPTHRLEGRIQVWKFLNEAIEEVDRQLEEINAKLYIKLHFYHSLEIKMIREAKNVRILTDKMIDQDIYNVINDFDLLITDYSSIFFDWLLSEKPIIFAPFDLEKYVKEDRELYYDYEKITPGPKCRTWGEVLEWIKKFKKHPELYRDERIKMKNLFHKYQDGKFSERIYEKVIELIE